MKKISIAICSFLFSLSSHAADSPTAVTKHFYDWRFHAHFTGVPDEATLNKASSLLSSDLTCLLDRARQYRDLFIQKFPTDKPPFIEGDMFTSVFEGANRYSVKSVRINGAEATALLQFYHDEGKKMDKKGWRDTVRLTQKNDQWRITDIQYGGNFNFGNSGSLRQNLLEELGKDDKEMGWSGQKQLQLCRP